MKLSLVSPAAALFVVSSTILAPTFAIADAPAAATVACVSGQFGDHVEGGHVVGDATAIFAAKKAVYLVDVANAGEPTTVTLVWSLDDREVQRQTLDVGRAPHWHTWGMRPLGGAHKVDVEVLDAAGRSLKKDSLAAG